MNEKRLRVVRVVVQPILVWDDGEELTPGPQVDPVNLSASQIHAFADGLVAQVADLAEKLTTNED